jgi:hypothetical protein
MHWWIYLVKEHIAGDSRNMGCLGAVCGLRGAKKQHPVRDDALDIRDSLDAMHVQTVQMRNAFRWLSKTQKDATNRHH